MLGGKDQHLRYTAKAIMDAIENDDYDLLSKCIKVDPTVVHRRNPSDGSVAFHAANSVSKYFSNRHI